MQTRGGALSAREQRKLAAIVAADVVGYSRLMGRDESGTVARLRRVVVRRSAVQVWVCTVRGSPAAFNRLSQRPRDSEPLA